MCRGNILKTSLKYLKNYHLEEEADSLEKKDQGRATEIPKQKRILKR